MNGKVERFFRTFKYWVRLTLFAWKPDWIQRRLDWFRAWYNAARVHQALGGQTPEQVWSGVGMPEAKPIRAHDPQPSITVLRRHYRGDLHLPVLDIRVEYPDAA